MFIEDDVEKMIAITVILYALGGFLELFGVLLVVHEAIRANRELKQWIDLNPNRNEGGSYLQSLRLNQTVMILLGNQVKRWWAIVSLILGIVIGISGNILSIWVSPG